MLPMPHEAAVGRLQSAGGAVLAPELQVSRWFNAPADFSLQGLRGQVVLVHVFQMLCPGCVSHALPQALAVHRAYAGRGVVTLGLHSVFEHHAAMQPLALEAFLHEYRLEFPVGVDAPVAGSPLPATLQRYGLRGTPTLLLVDRAGRLRRAHFGRLDDLTLGVWLGQLLAEPEAGEPKVPASPTALQRADPLAVSPSAGCGAQGCPIG